MTKEVFVYWLITAWRTRDLFAFLDISVACWLISLSSFFYQTVKYLLADVGCDENSSNALNKDGLTAVDILDYCPRNSRSLEILEILLRAGIRKAKGLPNSPPQSSTKPMELIQETSLPYWIEKTRGNFMVVATIIASICFQAGLNPPGGLW